MNAAYSIFNLFVCLLFIGLGLGILYLLMKAAVKSALNEKMEEIKKMQDMKIL